MPNHYVGDLLHTIGISGLSRVRTELLRLAVVAALAPHPVQMHRQLSRHRYLRDLPSSSHGEVEECVAPLGLAPYCDLRRFHQQEAQQHVALLTDVSRPLAALAFVLIIGRAERFQCGKQIAAYGFQKRTPAGKADGWDISANRVVG